MPEIIHNNKEVTHQDQNLEKGNNNLIVENEGGKGVIEPLAGTKPDKTVNKEATQDQNIEKGNNNLIVENPGGFGIVEPLTGTKVLDGDLIKYKFYLKFS